MQILYVCIYADFVCDMQILTRTLFPNLINIYTFFQKAKPFFPAVLRYNWQTQIV